jgi:hypothetical protein
VSEGKQIDIGDKIAQTYNVELSLQAFFQASTLADLATKLEEKLIEQAEADQLEELLREVEQKSR